MRLPAREGPIRRVALTGSIATGKSTAARLFGALGVPVVDADQLARDAVEPGRPAWEEIRRAFGPSVFAKDGRLDRPALARLVFSDPAARRRLDAIVHPVVEAEAERELARLLAADPGGFAVYNVPLLFETGAEGRFDLVVAVYAGREAQRARLRARNGYSDAEIEARIAAQGDAGEKARRADVALDNEGPPAALEAQVRELVALLRAHNAEKIAKKS